MLSGNKKLFVFVAYVSHIQGTSRNSDLCSSSIIQSHKSEADKNYISICEKKSGSNSENSNIMIDLNTIENDKNDLFDENDLSIDENLIAKNMINLDFSWVFKQPIDQLFVINDVFDEFYRARSFDNSAYVNCELNQTSRSDISKSKNVETLNMKRKFKQDTGQKMIFINSSEKSGDNRSDSNLNILKNRLSITKNTTNDAEICNFFCLNLNSGSTTEENLEKNVKNSLKNAKDEILDENKDTLNKTTKNKKIYAINEVFDYQKFSKEISPHLHEDENHNQENYLFQFTDRVYYKNVPLSIKENNSINFIVQEKFRNLNRMLRENSNFEISCFENILNILKNNYDEYLSFEDNNSFTVKHNKYLTDIVIKHLEEIKDIEIIDLLLPEFRIFNVQDNIKFMVNSNLEVSFDKTYRFDIFIRIFKYFQSEISKFKKFNFFETDIIDLFEFKYFLREKIIEEIGYILNKNLLNIYKSMNYYEKNSYTHKFTNISKRLRDKSKNKICIKNKDINTHSLLLRMFFTMDIETLNYNLFIYQDINLLRTEVTLDRAKSLKVTKGTVISNFFVYFYSNFPFEKMKAFKKKARCIDFLKSFEKFLLKSSLRKDGIENLKAKFFVANIEKIYLMIEKIGLRNTRTCFQNCELCKKVKRDAFYTSKIPHIYNVFTFNKNFHCFLNQCFLHLRFIDEDDFCCMFQEGYIE